MGYRTDERFARQKRSSALTLLMRYDGGQVPDHVLRVRTIARDMLSLRLRLQLGAQVGGVARRVRDPACCLIAVSTSALLRTILNRTILSRKDPSIPVRF